MRPNRDALIESPLPHHRLSYTAMACERPERTGGDSSLLL
jgi:hypothetical protein